MNGLRWDKSNIVAPLRRSRGYAYALGGIFTLQRAKCNRGGFLATNSNIDHLRFANLTLIGKGTYFHFTSRSHASRLTWSSHWDIVGPCVLRRL